VVVVTDTGPVTIGAAQVARIIPLDTGGLRDLKVTLSAGYNFAKANSVKATNVGLAVTQRTTERIVKANLSINHSDSGDSETSQRKLLGTSYSRLLPNRWLASGLLSFDSNDELDLSLRRSRGAAALCPTWRLRRQ